MRAIFTSLSRALDVLSVISVDVHEPTSPRSHKTRSTCFSTSGSALRDSGLTGSSVLETETEGLAVSFGSSSDTFSVKKK